MDSRVDWRRRSKKVVWFVPPSHRKEKFWKQFRGKIPTGLCSICESNSIDDPGLHTDMVLMEEAPKFGNPPVLLADMRPKEPPLLFILDNNVAEQITKPTKMFSTSIPKTPNMKNLSPLVGERSLVNLDVSLVFTRTYLSEHETKNRDANKDCFW